MSLMIIKVLIEVKYFFVMFLICLIMFAECFNVLHVNVDAYGRVPRIIALSLTQLRSAMGDFDMLNPKQTFDLIDKNTGEYIYD